MLKNTRKEKKQKNFQNVSVINQNIHTSNLIFSVRTLFLVQEKYGGQIPSSDSEDSTSEEEDEDGEVSAAIKQYRIHIQGSVTLTTTQ